MSLKSGKRISSNRWEQLPISEDVINRVHKLVEIEKRPLMTQKEMVFEWEPGIPIDIEPLAEEERINNDNDEADDDINNQIMLDRANLIIEDDDHDQEQEENENNPILQFEEGDQAVNIIEDEPSTENEDEKYLKEIEENAEYEELNSNDFSTEDEDDKYSKYIEENTDNEKLNSDDFRKERSIEDEENQPLMFNDEERHVFEDDIDLSSEDSSDDVVDNDGIVQESTRPTRNVSSTEKYL